VACCAHKHGCLHLVALARSVLNRAHPHSGHVPDWASDGEPACFAHQDCLRAATLPFALEQQNFVRRAAMQAVMFVSVHPPSAAARGKVHSWGTHHSNKPAPTFSGPSAAMLLPEATRRSRHSLNDPVPGPLTGTISCPGSIQSESLLVFSNIIGGVGCRSCSMQFSPRTRLKNCNELRCSYTSNVNIQISEPFDTPATSRLTALTACHCLAATSKSGGLPSASCATCINMAAVRPHTTCPW
jgi:hypothetical protein